MTSLQLPLIIEPEQVVKLLGNEQLLIIAVCRAAVFDALHIPGAVLIEPGELVSGQQPAVGKLPSVEHLSKLFSRIGLNEHKHVIVYDDEGGGWAGRLIWTLDVLGHQHYSFLNGGLISWRADQHPLESASTAGSTQNSEYSVYQATIDRTVIASLEDVLAQINDDSSVVWDARGEDEFSGRRQASLRSGHIPGAVNLDWLDTMDRSNSLRLLPLNVLKEKLESLGISSEKSVITHCQSHHRSGLTYLIGKALGLNIRAYDGSWAEWGNHPDTPIES